LGQRYRLIHERLSAEAETGSPDSRERLANTERAYTVLSSPALRAQYDAALARGESGVNIGAAPGEFAAVATRVLQSQPAGGAHS